MHLIPYHLVLPHSDAKPWPNSHNWSFVFPVYDARLRLPPTQGGWWSFKTNQTAFSPWPSLRNRNLNTRTYLAFASILVLQKQNRSRFITRVEWFDTVVQGSIVAFYLFPSANYNKSEKDIFFFTFFLGATNEVPYATARMPDSSGKWIRASYHVSRWMGKVKDKDARPVSSFIPPRIYQYEYNRI